MLAIVSDLFGIARLSDEIRGTLDSLRRLRNKLAHTGSIAVLPDAMRASELVVAATFGFHYGRFFRRELAKKGSAAPVRSFPAAPRDPPDVEEGA